MVTAVKTWEQHTNSAQIASKVASTFGQAMAPKKKARPAEPPLMGASRLTGDHTGQMNDTSSPASSNASAVAASSCFPPASASGASTVSSSRFPPGLPQQRPQPPGADSEQVMKVILEVFQDYQLKCPAESPFWSLSRDYQLSVVSLGCIGSKYNME